MSCDRRCFDKTDRDYGRSDCSTCPGRDDGKKEQKCQHINRECVYESDDGEFERWQCKDCGQRWGREIAQ